MVKQCPGHSWLKPELQEDLKIQEKGMAGIRTTDVPLTAYVCPSTLK